MKNILEWWTRLSMIAEKLRHHHQKPSPIHQNCNCWLKWLILFHGIIDKMKFKKNSEK